MKNIDIRNLAKIGLTDVDVYKTNHRKFSATSPKLLMFFRSPDQAKGLPKDSSGKNNDMKYNQSFGFDMFCQHLYGNNTDVYKNGYYEKKVVGGKTVDDKSREKIVGKLESFYEKDPNLTYELKDPKAPPASYFIDETYTLSKRNKKMADISYYIPNVLIKPGQQVILSVKFFDTDNASKLGAIVSFKLSNNKGIETFTPSLTFNKNEDVLDFIIKTKASEFIADKTTITAFISDGTGKELEIGKINLLPNQLLKAKSFFIDVFYNTTTPTAPFNGTTMINDLNMKALNQSSVELISGGANKTMFIKANDQELVDGKYDGQPISNILTNKGAGKPYELNDLNKALRIITSRFYEEIINEIIINTETELKNLDVNDGTAIRKLIDPSSSLKGVLDDLDITKPFNSGGSIMKRYDFIKDRLYGYLHYEFKINYLFAFICHNIETKITTTSTATTSTTSRDEAMAFLDAKEIIIPNNAIGKTMTLAHEIAHCFGVRHTFDIPGSSPQIGDLKLPQQKTLENIMDYPKNGDADRRSFIKYQWDKIRESVSSRVNTVAELNFEQHTDRNQSGLVDFTKETGYIWDYSRNLMDFLMRAMEKKYNGDYSEIRNSSDKILTIFANEITKTLNKL
ncbi:hypothetical protein [Chryseobacterium cucumeris]|uniref:hypothetical protein n=1 Tax=Chryseobacterium cucumeris TaxID=1813611 RepID=UPI003D99BD3D